MTPKILGNLQVGMGWLLRERGGLWLYSAGSGVKRVQDDFSGEIMRRLEEDHCSMVLM